jgi:hypothetical protein
VAVKTPYLANGRIDICPDTERQIEFGVRVS